MKLILTLLLSAFWAAWMTSSAASQQPKSTVYMPMISNGKVFTNELINIPAGKFMMGCYLGAPQSCFSNELPLHAVYLDAYQIQKYEVTNGEYAACVASGSCTLPFQRYSRTRPNYYGAPDYASYPVQYVTYYQARDYCHWAGMRLPSEAEWEKAARGNSGAPPYPWGFEPPECGLLSAAFCQEDTTRAGSYESGASPYALMDGSGNVWEWVSDWYAQDYYSVSPTNNPAGPNAGTHKVIRGGSFFHDMSYARVSFRFPFEPGRIGSFGLGFRCARSK